jgi:hypothetical protein
VFIEWSNCFCFLDFVSYFSQPSETPRRARFLSASWFFVTPPHRTPPQAPDDKQQIPPPSPFIPGINLLFNSYSILFRSARTIVPVGGLFRVCYTSSTFSLRLRHQASLPNETCWNQAPWLSSNFTIEKLVSIRSLSIALQSLPPTCSRFKIRLPKIDWPLVEHTSPHTSSTLNPAIIPSALL